MKHRVSRPLSVWTYHLRNKRRTIPLLAVLTLAVLGLSLGVVVNDTFIKATDLHIQQYQYFTVVRPNRNQGHDTVSRRVQRAIRQNSHLKTMYSVVENGTFVPGVLSPAWMPVYMIEYASLEQVLADLGLHVVDGRLPGGGEAHDNWLILSKFVAETRGLSVGNEIGWEVNRRKRVCLTAFRLWQLWMVRPM